MAYIEVFKDTSSREGRKDEWEVIKTGGRETYEETIVTLKE
jgi:hypothetical protein